jgi:hypothetical protein
MAVRMMRIRHVRMRVPQRLMPMPVTVRTGGRRIMVAMIRLSRRLRHCAQADPI